MMMQIVRCESAVAQGLRSDTSQATKMAASACERLPYPLLPLACWLWTSPHITSLAPKCPQISDRIGFRKVIHFDMCLSLSLVNGCWLAFHFQMPPVWNQNGSHRLLPSTFLRCPLYSEISQGVKCEPVWCCRCTASGCWSAAASPGHSTGAAAKIMIFARRKVTQAALYGALRWWCRTDTHRALAFVAHALQGPLLTRIVQHPRLWNEMNPWNMHDFKIKFKWKFAFIYYLMSTN